MCGKVCTRFIVFNVLGIGGKPSPNIWSDAFRCEIYVDDLPLAAGGSYLHSRAAGHRRLGFSSLGTKPVSVTVWCRSVPSSQLKAPASQWPFQKTTSMPCTTRRPSSCQPQLHKRKLFAHSSASCRVLLVWSRRSVPSLTWSRRRWPQAPVCIWNSSTVGASGWRCGGCRLFSEVLGPLVRVFPVTAWWAPEGQLNCHRCRALRVLLVSCLKVSSLWRGTLLHS